MRQHLAQQPSIQGVGYPLPGGFGEDAPGLGIEGVLFKQLAAALLLGDKPTELGEQLGKSADLRHIH